MGTNNWKEDVEEKLLVKPKKRYASWTEELNLDNLALLGPQWWVIRVSRVTGQETADHLLAFLEVLDKPNVAVNFDPANMILYDMDEPIEALRKLAPHVQQVHVKDAKRTTVKGQWGEEVVVGTGQVDLAAFVRILAENDYEGDYIFEREAGDDRVGDIAKGIAALKAAMEEAGA